MTKEDSSNVSGLWWRKALGFCVGFGGSAAVTVALAMDAGVMPRGLGWIFFFIACGMGMAKLFARPRQTVNPVLIPMSKHWWLLDQWLRLALVACCIWIGAAFTLQDKYDRDLRWIFVPPCALLMLYFAFKQLINPQKLTPPTDESIKPYQPSEKDIDGTGIDQPKGTDCALNPTVKAKLQVRDKSPDPVMKNVSLAMQPHRISGSDLDVNSGDSKSPLKIKWALIISCFCAAGLAVVSFLGPAVGRGSTAEPPRGVEVSQQQTRVASTAHTLLPTLSVAAMRAHLRRDASAASPSIGILNRGMTFVPAAEDAGFVKLVQPGGREGWVARNVLVAESSALRLQQYTPSQYLNTPGKSGSFDLFASSIDPHSMLRQQLFEQVLNTSPDVVATIAEIEALKLFSPEVDADGALWFALEAKWRLENDTASKALIAVRAAVEANPADVPNLIAWGMTAIGEGEYNVLEKLVRVLPLLAPRSTNTWLIVGLLAAVKGDERLSAGALDFALAQSRNINATRSHFASIATKSTNYLVERELRAAIRRSL